MGDTHLAQGTPSPSSDRAVHRVDEPSPAVLGHRTDRFTKRATGRYTRERHPMSRTLDSHPADTHGHSTREDRKVLQRLRKRISEQIGVEMPLEEEDNMDRQVGDNGIADIAADFEPLCAPWFDQ